MWFLFNPIRAIPGIGDIRASLGMRTQVKFHPNSWLIFGPGGGWNVPERQNYLSKLHRIGHILPEARVSCDCVGQ